jgi:hypothetical protein
LVEIAVADIAAGLPFLDAFGVEYLDLPPARL